MQFCKKHCRSASARKAAAILGAVLAGASAAGLALTPLPRPELAAMIGRYQAWDAMFHHGRGDSESSRSGGLAWGEARFLEDYVRCYRVSRDPYWLDKIVDHFDRMLANAAEPDGDGFRGWRDRKFSVAIITARPAANTAGLQLTPRRQRPYVIRGGGAVTGHDYRLEFSTSSRFVIRDMTAGTILASKHYTPSMRISDIPGAVFHLAGRARPGAAFRIRTTAPEQIEYQVHDGMIAYPIAQFIEIVRADPRLRPRYGLKAKTYAEFIRRNILRKWERTWFEYGHGLGLYRFTANPTQRFPGASLPHNQYLALARAYLVMQAAANRPAAELYRDRARKMLMNFKHSLRLHHGRYVWNYWDPLPAEAIPRSHAEDISHGSIDVGAVLEAAARGIVFTRQDLERFARTYLDVMWNRKTDPPAFSRRVDGTGRAAPFYTVWIGLATVEPRVWNLARRMYFALHRPPTMGPQLALLHQRLFGADPRLHAECRKQTRRLVAMLAHSDTTTLFNGSFEQGWPAAGIVLGWELTSWSPGKTGRAEYVDGGYDGRRAVRLIGAGPKVNLLALSLARIPAAGKKQCTVTAYYRTQGHPRPFISILGYDDAGKRVFYLSSAPFPPSTSWRKAAYTGRLSGAVRTVRILLRNGGIGVVDWDAARVNLR